MRIENDDACHELDVKLSPLTLVLCTFVTFNSAKYVVDTTHLGSDTTDV